MTNTQRAFLDAIARPESAGAYDRRYAPTGIATFSDFSRHLRVYEANVTPGYRPSSAAGRYQMVHSTWAPLAERLGLSDFSPESQDAAAWALANETYARETGRDLLSDLNTGDRAILDNVARTLSGQWASLAGGVQEQRDTFARDFLDSMAYYGAADRASNPVAAEQLPGSMAADQIDRLAEREAQIAERQPGSFLGDIIGSALGAPVTGAIRAWNAVGGYLSPEQQAPAISDYGLNNPYLSPPLTAPRPGPVQSAPLGPPSALDPSTLSYGWTRSPGPLSMSGAAPSLPSLGPSMPDFDSTFGAVQGSLRPFSAGAPNWGSDPLGAVRGLVPSLGPASFDPDYSSLNRDAIGVTPDMSELRSDRIGVDSYGNRPSLPSITAPDMGNPFSGMGPVSAPTMPDFDATFGPAAGSLRPAAPEADPGIGGIVGSALAAAARQASAPQSTAPPSITAPSMGNPFAGMGPVSAPVSANPATSLGFSKPAVSDPSQKPGEMGWTASATPLGTSVGGLTGTLAPSDVPSLGMAYASQIAPLAPPAPSAAPPLPSLPKAPLQQAPAQPKALDRPRVAPTAPSFAPGSPVMDSLGKIVGAIGDSGKAYQPSFAANTPVFDDTGRQVGTIGPNDGMQAQKLGLFGGLLGPGGLFGGYGPDSLGGFNTGYSKAYGAQTYGTQRIGGGSRSTLGGGDTHAAL